MDVNAIINTINIYTKKYPYPKLCSELCSTANDFVPYLSNPLYHCWYFNILLNFIPIVPECIIDIIMQIFILVSL